MSLSAKREYLARIHGCHQRAGRQHKTRILDEFCATCGYHRKSALRLLHRPLTGAALRRRPGPQPTYDPEVLRPVLKVIWLESDQLCSKLLKAALPEWLLFYQHHHRRLTPEVQAKLAAISLAQIDRLLRPARVGQPKKGLGATKPGTLLRRQAPTRSGPPDTSRPGTIEVDTVAHCDDTTAGDDVHSLTFTELYSGWTENRAVWNKAGHAILAQLQELEGQVPFPMTSFHSDNGSEFLNWPLHRYLSQRPWKVPWTRSRAYRKNDNAHCEQKKWTHVRQLLGYQRFAHPELVPLLNELYAQECSPYHNHFRPTFKLARREKRAGKTIKIYEQHPKTPYQRLLESPDIPESTKVQLRAQHARLDPFALKKGLEGKLKNFFTRLGNLDRESTLT
jgi:transposase InsO family protein